MLCFMENCMSKENKKSQEVTTPIEQVSITFNDLFNSILEGYKTDGTEKDKRKAISNIKGYLQQIVTENPISNTHNILILHDSTTMMKSDADNIYNSVTNFEKIDKPILLVLYSNGGVIGSAYLIGQLCREYSNKLIISVPRQAKSAATLLCCAGNEIHMGSLSELGPIDPQINGLPVLGLKNSIEHIASLVKDAPESAEMFARYLNYSVKPIDIGHYERVAESATQYAEKLLKVNQSKLPKTIKNIAYDLVYSYKDHSFVIDKSEAMSIFGDKIVKINTDEYKLSNNIYSEISKIERLFRILGYNFYHIGALDSDSTITKKT